jgi:hypothetical protein
MPCGIYTRKVWWRDNTGNSTAFSPLPIWYAYYDNAADFDDWYYPSYWYEGPFGGWTDPTGKQYNDRPYLCGSGVDHNIMYPAGDLPPPPVPEVPPAPTGLAPNGSSFGNDSSVTLICNPITGVTQYEFEIWYQSAGTWYQYYTYAPNTNSQTFWPAYNNTAYQWHVRAHNATGVGPWSAWATFKMGMTPPAAPTGLAASAISTSRIDLSWADASSDEIGFKIQRQVVGGTFSTIATVGANVTSYSNTGLTADTLYRYRVWAYNGAGNSTFSNTASATTLAEPPPAIPQPVLRQVFWRGGVGYSRTVPFVSGTSTPDWARASGWSSQSAAGLPGWGTVQSWDTYAQQSGLLEAFWRGNQGYYRLVPWASNGHPNYAAAPAWRGPLSPSGLPGVGSIQAQDSCQVGSVMWQSFGRGDQGWYRTVPVDSGGNPIWNQARSWNGPLGLNGLPGQGSIQTLSGEVYAGKRNLLQSLWRSNQGYWRTVPIDAAGNILWSQARPWSAPIPISGLPGSGNIEAQAGAVYYIK